MNVFAPIRAWQEAIAAELQHLGFDGTIHGLIIDLDFWNHVILNPSNGTISFYYSPTFGQIHEFESFEAQLHYLGKDATELHQLASNGSSVLLSGDNVLQCSETQSDVADLTEVSKSRGAYAASRRVASYQRLFTGHVLCDFDVCLCEPNEFV